MISKDKFKKLVQSKKVTMAELKSMNVKQRQELRKTALVYVTDADVNGNPDFLGAFIREVVEPKGEIKK